MHAFTSDLGCGSFFHSLAPGSHDDNTTALFQDGLPPRINEAFVRGHITCEAGGQVLYELDIVRTRGSNGYSVIMPERATRRPRLNP